MQNAGKGRNELVNYYTKRATELYPDKIDDLIKTVAKDTDVQKTGESAIEFSRKLYELAKNARAVATEEPYAQSLKLPISQKYSNPIREKQTIIPEQIIPASVKREAVTKQIPDPLTGYSTYKTIEVKPAVMTPEKVIPEKVITKQYLNRKALENDPIIAAAVRKGLGDPYIQKIMKEKGYTKDSTGFWHQILQLMRADADNASSVLTGDKNLTKAGQIKSSISRLDSVLKEENPAFRITQQKFAENTKPIELAD